MADPKRFPSGLKALADYLHARSLKFGLYTARGSRTCLGRPGSDAHEQQDANFYASIGVDYLKVSGLQQHHLNSDLYPSGLCRTNPTTRKTAAVAR